MNRFCINLFRSSGVLLLFALCAGVMQAQTVQVFTTSGTFTVPACVTSITVMCWGAGGGGGGAAEPGGGASGSGGGGGGFAMAVLNNVSGTYTITVGTGGASGVGTANTAPNGGNGGSSIFTNGTVTVTGVGGTGGTGNTSGVGATVGQGGGGTFVGCTGITYTGGNGALGNNQHDNTGGAGGGGAGNAGNGATPAQTQQDANGIGGAGGAGNPSTAQYAGGAGGSVTAAFYENGGNGATIGGGGAGGGGENQFFNGTGPGIGGTGGNGQVIVVYSVSTPTITSVTGSGCPGSTVTINGTLLTGATSVTINGTSLSNLSITSTQITGTLAAGTTTGTVTVTTPCGTASSATPFTVYPSNVVNLGNHTFCTSYTFGGHTYTTGGNYSDTVPSLVSGCDSITNITLTAGSVIRQSLNQSICSGSSYSFNGHALTTAGTYTDTVISALTGCDSITTLTLTVVQTPAGTITPASRTVCPGVSTTLTASPASSYLWSDGSTTSSITVSPASTTTYSVVENNSGCTATGTSLITATPFSISIIPDTSRSCAAQHVTLTCSYQSANTNGYTWSPASAGLSQGVVVFPDSTTIYSVTVSDANNCSASATAIVIVDQLPLSITPASAGVCSGRDTTLTAISNPGVAFAWSNGAGSAANLVTPVVTTIYYVTASDVAGCQAIDSVTVTVGTAPTAAFTVTTPVCAGKNSNITFTGSASAAAVYNWGFDGGNVASGSNKGPYQVNWDSAGIQQVILNISDNGCSSLPDTMTVTVNPAPVAAAGAPVAFCGYDSATLGNTATVGYSYLWTPATGLSSTTVSNPTVTLPNTGNTPVLQTYYVTATSNNCSATDSVVVTVKPAPQALFVNPAAQCLNGNRFTFASTGAALATDSFSWTFGTNATPASSSLQSQVVTYSAPQTTAVSLTISRAGCVGNTYTDSVTVYPEPVAGFNADSTTGCPGVSICFNNTSVSAGNVSYNWNFGDGQSSTAATPCHVYATAGNYTINLSVNANGCVIDSSVLNYITINVAPTAAFTPSTTVVQQPQTEVDFTNTSANATNYNWDFGGLGSSTAVNSSFNFTQYGSYDVTLYAYNSFGCAGSTVKQIKVLPPQNYFIPNAFTPNNDGNNDNFYILAQEGVTVISFTVFDRIGEKVHDGPEPWDGTFNGKPCPDGVYVYMFKLQLVDNTDGVRRTGTVTLMR